MSPTVWAQLTAVVRGRLLSYRSARFALIGIGATLLHGLTLGTLASVGHVAPVYANTAALFLSAIFSYFGHRSFTFRSTARHIESGAKFVTQLGISWLVTSALAVYLIPIFGSWPVSALIMVLIPCLNYFVYARWTFR